MMAIDVVDRLEPVEIEQAEPVSALANRRIGAELFELLEKVAPVEETGQHIGVRQPLDLPAILRALGNVADHGNEQRLAVLSGRPHDGGAEIDFMAELVDAGDGGARLAHVPGLGGIGLEPGHMRVVASVEARGNEHVQRTADQLIAPPAEDGLHGIVAEDDRSGGINADDRLGNFVENPLVEIAGFANVHLGVVSHQITCIKSGCRQY